MKKVANIYLTKSRNGRPRRQPTGRRQISTPQWFSFAVVVAMTVLVCLAVNLRAYSEMKKEARQNEELTNEFERLHEENLSLQEEIHNLKSDSAVIEREARKLGMTRPNQK